MSSFVNQLTSSNAQAPKNTFRIGNTARPNTNGTWDWTFYVQPSQHIEEVIVELHETFPEPVHRLKPPQLELSCTGWGTFELDVQIRWRDGGQLQQKWMLQFKDQASDVYQDVEVPAYVLTRSLGTHNEVLPTQILPNNSGQDRTISVPASRDAFTSVLASAPSMDPGNDPLGKTWHGRMVQETLPPPRVTWQSLRKPREDKHGNKDAPEWLNATEYHDDPQAFAYKIRILAQALRCSKKTLAYTGAGLSVAAGIEQAAAGSAQAKETSPLEADPTLAHCVMAQLNRNNLLHGWVQQNHDGLPQKAGYKQEDINEIHGSWYDPSNPVVRYDGWLRGDLCADMEKWAKIADLVLVLGTSLSGLNADQCVSKTAARSQRNRSGKISSLGSVIISPQRTPMDGSAALRLFAPADEVMAALAQEFGLTSGLDPQQWRSQFSADLKVKVPYDKHGRKSDRVQTVWNLTPGAKLRVSKHNNVEGAQQPSYLHINPDIIGEAMPVNHRAGYVSVRFDRYTTMQLGVWWVEAAQRGGVDYLPFVNVDAVEEPQRR